MTATSRIWRRGAEKTGHHVNEFDGHSINNALTYFKVIAIESVHSLIICKSDPYQQRTIHVTCIIAVILDDCELQKAPRENLLKKWKRMINFNFRLDRNWKSKHTTPSQKFTKKCEIIDPDLPQGN